MHFNELVTIHIVPMKMSWRKMWTFWLKILQPPFRDQDSQYNFVIDRFLVDEPGNDILEDDEQPILFMNYSVRGRRLPPF